MEFHAFRCRFVDPLRLRTKTSVQIRLHQQLQSKQTENSRVTAPPAAATTTTINNRNGRRWSKTINAWFAHTHARAHTMCYRHSNETKKQKRKIVFAVLRDVTHWTLVDFRIFTHRKNNSSSGAVRMNGLDWCVCVCV